MLRLTAIAATLALATTAAAQPNPADFDLPETEPERLYHVEMILYAFDEGDRFEEDFHHGIENPRIVPRPELLSLPDIELESVFGFRQGAAIETPAAEPQIGAPDASTSGQAVTPAPDGETADVSDLLTDRLELFTANADGEIANASVPEGFRPLAADDLELIAEAARMNRRPYRLLGHAGWLQTGVDPDRAVRLDLKYLGITNPTGTVEVYVRRFLHVAVDLTFYDGNGTFWSPAVGFGPTPFDYAPGYRINDEINAIRSRSGMLHGIDHPLFGVLVRITPAPEPDEESATEDTDRPAG
jgi:hypothetical protein